jgi:peptidoglycan/xylan/chitin deacetylase (PgdA/CDA1 family)
MRALYALELVLAYALYFTGVYAAWRKRLQKRGARVALVYHRISSGRGALGEMTSERSFEWQMSHIVRHFKPAPWPALLEDNAPGGGVKVLVTFDDGYRDNFTRALPVIEKYGIHVVFFVVTDFVFGRKRIDEDDLEGDDDIFPAKEEVAEAARSPYVAFGNHTASHRIVSEQGVDGLEVELRRSQEAFGKHVGVTPEIFAYPRGREGDFGTRSTPVLEKAGIEAAFTMVPGLVDSRTPRYFVPRIGVSHVNDRVLFKVKMLGLLGWFVKIKNRLGG